jgi:1-acyl-sn-glycerol-3-phosphate acyltransferase
VFSALCAGGWAVILRRSIYSRLSRAQGHSILLLTNHFSWWDGFFANYAAFNNLKRRLYIMMQHDHFLQHWYFKYLGAFP